MNSAATEWKTNHCATVKRRELLKAAAGLLTTQGLMKGNTVSCASPVESAPLAEHIWSVNGPVHPAQVGLALAHEHIFSRFGEEPRPHHDYDAGRIIATVLPYLKYLRALGCRTIFDCTAAYFGRAPLMLRRLAAASGLHLVTNTGYYGAANDRYVPAHAFTESADQLARRWLAEWRKGIGDTGIRPGFIKTGVDDGSLSDIDRKLITAAARTHLESGLTIASHTGNNPAAAIEQISVLRAEGVAPAAWIWVHANAVEDSSVLRQVAESGAWLGFDGLRQETMERHLELVLEMRRHGLLGRVLVSHDGNSHPAGGRAPRPYDLLFTTFRYKLLEAGLTQAEVGELIARNPQQAFTVRIRRLGVSTTRTV